ncbi:VOC family protein [Paracoccus onubensis]|uniref:Lactoylglutathione lyase n=1 Tax=Paracoccus onubensis TaxID=1675788 RepID=A0A418SY97_9RHOB|nr:VOC family protein [Paracoccus onubensis]RJE85909.1 lactoylglutathione lyase [Paracoccus onubensis]
MPRMIFVNLPVADVEKSAAFYQAIGATRDERFCQEATTAMMTFSDTITFMLLSHERFADFTSKQIIDANTQVEALFCLSENSREAVDATLAKALAAGGKADPTPRQEMGDFMYGRSFEDLDGHIFEVMWMDVDKAMATWSEGAAAQ